MRLGAKRTNPLAHAELGEGKPKVRSLDLWPSSVASGFVSCYVRS